MAEILQSTDRLITLREAEALTGRKVSTWRRDIFERRVPVVHLGRRQVRLQLSVILEMVREGYRPAVGR
jgi:predicted DNA-binding transcriptional regulator AlpA